MDFDFNHNLRLNEINYNFEEIKLRRKIVKIDKILCNGCGLCVEACHEGAIKLIDGKAKLVSDQYCDGLGDCLPACPTGAIEIIEREAVPYDQKAVDARKNQKNKKEEALTSCVCSGGIPKNIVREVENQHACQCQSENGEIENDIQHTRHQAQLRNWPVQLKLINSGADYFDHADILISADCVAYAYGNFHHDFIKNRVALVGCPKLDDNEYYSEKLTEIFY